MFAATQRHPTQPYVQTTVAWGSLRVQACYMCVQCALGTNRTSPASRAGSSAIGCAPAPLVCFLDLGSFLFFSFVFPFCFVRSWSWRSPPPSAAAWKKKKGRGDASFPTGHQPSPSWSSSSFLLHTGVAHSARTRLGRLARPLLSLLVHVLCKGPGCTPRLLVPDPSASKGLDFSTDGPRSKKESL